LVIRPTAATLWKGVAADGGKAMSQKYDDSAAGFTDVEPVERRKVSRHRTLKGGSIRFNNGAAYDCRVRNLSAAGAMLEVAGQLGIPEEFTLVIDADHFRQNCRVIWRTTTRLGVAFL
jgi:hypothetical protein